VEATNADSLWWLLLIADGEEGDGTGVPLDEVVLNREVDASIHALFGLEIVGEYVLEPRVQ